MIYAWTCDFDLQLAFRNNIFEFEMSVFYCILGRIVDSFEFLVDFLVDFPLLKGVLELFLNFIVNMT